MKLKPQTLHHRTIMIVLKYASILKISYSAGCHYELLVGAYQTTFKLAQELNSLELILPSLITSHLYRCIRSVKICMLTVHHYMPWPLLMYYTISFLLDNILNYIICISWIHFPQSKVLYCMLDKRFADIRDQIEYIRSPK